MDLRDFAVVRTDAAHGRPCRWNLPLMGLGFAIQVDFIDGFGDKRMKKSGRRGWLSALGNFLLTLKHSSNTPQSSAPGSWGRNTPGISRR